MEIAAVPADAEPAAGLIAAMVAEIDGLYDIDMAGDPRAPGAAPSDFAPPGGTFLVLFDDGRPVAGGGLKRLEPGLAEVKRMYVVPDARGRGVARALLGALEDAARALGHERLRLDTGPEQPHARALFESAGYAEIPDYNGNPFANWFGEKRLAAAKVRGADHDARGRAPS